EPKADEPKASVAVEAPVAEPTAEQSGPKTGNAPSDELAVVARNGNGQAKVANGNGGGGSAITLSLGTTNVAFKIQEDAPSCADCGSIMIRNGSCYKCLNCGSTSGCS
ncbi:MAG TPA: hypothetical protein VGP30_00325, partial [Candidatus Limnocylindrales bacterium]|nr:hypothetical protein [Candidatus Limnocylindrales bacterium]